MKRFKYFNSFKEAQRFQDRVRGRMRCIDEGGNLYVVVYQPFKCDLSKVIQSVKQIYHAVMNDTIMTA